MKGGMYFHHGTGAGARRYVESDHSVHASAYYLKEGRGLASELVYSGTGVVTNRAELNGDQYERWVEGYDPRTGEAKGRLRSDDKAMRFCEVTVNGPKTWSIAAGLHRDISDAYDAAQDRAVEAIGRFLAMNVTARVGSRGAQQQVHVDQMSMAAIRHYTSRAGDPHRHIHLQVNARVVANGKWYGLDSAALLRMQRAINGIGHRAVLADPAFRQAIAARGYHLTAAGEIAELAAYAPAMSKRSKQVERNLNDFRARWDKAYPGQAPGTDILREWDMRAWNKNRPPKKAPAPGMTAEEGWISELRELGVNVEALTSMAPTAVTGTMPGAIDRNELAVTALQVVASGSRGRSTWNDYDVRGVVEELLADEHLYGTDQTVAELAEDIADRVIARSQSVILDRPVVAAHIRHLTSQSVVDLEKDLTGRMAARAIVDHEPATYRDVKDVLDREARTLDRGQVEAVQAIAGTGALVVVEGPAGAGKTSVLATARDLVEAGGSRMVVVAPSKKAAEVASDELDTEANTAAALAYAHGFRWNRKGVWTRLAKGEVDPKTGIEFRGARLTHKVGAGDVLVIDEADMLNQETAQALLHVADEGGARVVLMGDRRQLTAVGRGGVMSMAVKWAPAVVELDQVHRFRNADGTRDDQYADLSLQLRGGEHADRVFDELVKTGHVVLHETEQAAVEAVAATASGRILAGETESVSVPTNEMTAAVNESARVHLVAAGRVDDQVVTHGSDGLRIGAGDRVMTRLNMHEKGVANRMTWDVRSVHPDGSLTLADTKSPRAAFVPADYVQEHVHLAYAATIHAVQGETSRHGTEILTPSTDHAGLYVGLTRGRESNTVHIVAADHDAARVVFVEAAGRNRSDLGLEKATREAVEEANHYAQPDPIPRPYAAVSDRDLADRVRAAQTGWSTVGGQLDALREARAERPVPLSGVRARMEAQQEEALAEQFAAAEIELRDLGNEELLRLQHPELTVADVPAPAPVLEEDLSVDDVPARVDRDRGFGW